MNSLKMSFKTDSMDTDILTIDNVKDNLDLTEVTALANKIIAGDIIAPNHGIKYETLVGAVITTSTANVLM